MPSPIPDPEVIVLRRGVGFLPPGGAVGEILTKTDDEDYAADWQPRPVLPALSWQDGYLLVSDGVTTKRARGLELED